MTLLIFIFIAVEWLLAIFLFWLTASIIYSFLIIKVPALSSAHGLVKAIGELESINPQTELADLGCGNGRFLRSITDYYRCRGEGFELAWPSFMVAKLLSWSSGGKMKVHYRDFFKVDIRPYSVIYLYLFPELMARLEKQWEGYRGSGKVIISNTFTFTQLRPTASKTIQLWNGKYTLYRYVL